jgi:two-component system sensor histidine kinase RpfC
VSDGQAAVEALLEGHFDLVLMDVNMPVMNGVEAAKLYRFASLGQRSVPIVALTADATAETEARCREAGIDVCVTKPVEPARLLEVIASLTRGAESGDIASPVPSEAIADITSHPNFRPGQGVDLRVLEDLEKLGGAEFVSDLVAQFLADAAEILREVEKSVSLRDLEAFKDRLHALRSAAANIGAQRLHEMCLSWRQIGLAELANQGDDHLAKLREEFKRVQTTLKSRNGDVSNLTPIRLPTGRL